MPYTPASREERPHRFLPYPNDERAHLCVRCGLTEEQGHHGGVKAAAIRTFDNLEGRRLWTTFGKTRTLLTIRQRCYRCGSRHNVRKRPSSSHLCDTCWEVLS